MKKAESPTWTSDVPPPVIPVGPMGVLRAVLRGLPLAVLVFGGLGVLLVLRLVERPLFGLARPVTPFVTQGVCRGALMLIGLRYVRRGRPMRHAGAVVANHSSWLDIFVLNAAKRIYFVSKAEVAGWAGIGWLARATGTVFVARDRRAAAAQVQMLQDRLAAGHRLVFFPEGTSTDGRRVLPFKPTLFAALMSAEVWVQPVSVIYHAPPGVDRRFYGWWGGMDFAPHLLVILAAPRRGSVTVTYHDPIPVAEVSDRKALAAQAEAAVRSGFVAAGVVSEP